MVDKECRVENAPGAMLEILLSYSDSRRTEFRPVNVWLSMQLIWLLLSILKKVEKVKNTVQTCSSDSKDCYQINPLKALQTGSTIQTVPIRQMEQTV